MTTHRIHQNIRFFMLLAAALALQFSLPLSVYAATKKPQAKLIARRDPITARLATSKALPRQKPVESKPKYLAVRKLTMVVTAYSSTRDQCGSDPFTTASGTKVHQGTFAVNGVPFGTKIRIPEHFGDQIFIVEDRMHSRYSSYRGDIWMETRNQAIHWGARRVQVEVVKEAGAN